MNNDNHTPSITVPPSVGQFAVGERQQLLDANARMKADMARYEETAGNCDLFRQQLAERGMPDEHCHPGLEVGIVAHADGIRFGGALISWADIDEARTLLAAKQKEQ